MDTEQLTSLCKWNPDPNLIRFRGKKVILFLSLIPFCVGFLLIWVFWGFFFSRTWRLRGNLIPVTHIIKLLLYRRQNIDKIDLDSYQTMNAEVANLAAKAAGSAWFTPRSTHTLAAMSLSEILHLPALSAHMTTVQIFWSL